MLFHENEMNASFWGEEDFEPSCVFSLLYPLSLETGQSFMWLREIGTEIKPTFIKPLVQVIFCLLQILFQGTQQEDSWKQMYLLDN